MLGRLTGKPLEAPKKQVAPKKEKAKTEEKKKPATAEDLDAELMSYTAARSSTDMTAEATAAS